MIQMPAIRFDAIAMKGGLDQVTPTLGLPSGIAKQSSNFECSVYGGYTRIAGHERFDGRPSPSDATQTLVYIASMAVLPSVGDTLTGASSGATGVVCEVENGYCVITKQSLAFAVGEMARVGATDIGLVTASTGPVDAMENAIHLAAATDIYRADIGAVPGSGPVRGGFMFGDAVYAFRDNAAGTAVEMYKSSSSGWTLVPFLYEVSFTAGTNEPAEGDTLTQGGVTALIKRVCTETDFNAATGVWSPGAATGRFIIAAPSGGNFAAGAATAGGSTTVTLSGVQTAIVLNPGGKFEIHKENFSGALSTFRVYGCDGVNRAWEFDGTIFAPISTGNDAADDKPKHLRAHKGALFLSIQTSVFKSAPGWPFCFTAINGAAEFALGDTVTGLISGPGTQDSAALFMFCRSKTSILYGVDSTDFNLVSFNDGIGAIDYSIQNMAQTLAMDDRGAFVLNASQNYGNFEQATLTHNIRPFIEARRTNFSCSTMDRSKSQYRLFFTDGYGLYITIVNGKWIGSSPVYFPVPAFCAWEDKYSTGEEASFFGGTDGFVYQMEKGTSFDGENIYAFIVLNYASSGNSRMLKSYRKAAIECQGGGYAAFRFGYSLGYGSSEIAQPNEVLYATNFSSPYWDNFTWDNFYWDGQSLQPSECSMDGTAENVALAFYSDANYYQPFTLNTAIIHYLPRRAMR